MRKSDLQIIVFKYPVLTETAKVMVYKETGKCSPFKGKIITIYIIHFNTICYSSRKKSKCLSFSGQWIELESGVLSETSQALEAKYHLFFSQL